VLRCFKDFVQDLNVGVTMQSVFSVVEVFQNCVLFITWKLLEFLGNKRLITI